MFFLCLSLATFLSAGKSIGIDSFIVYTNETTITFDEKYVSATLDCSLWTLPTNGFDLLESSSLQLYAGNYKPSTLRFGGVFIECDCFY